MVNRKRPARSDYGSFPRRTLLRMAFAAGGTATGIKIGFDGAPAARAATIIRLAEFVDSSGGKAIEDAIAAAIAKAASIPDGVVDFEGVSYVTTATVTVSNGGVTLLNGGIKPTGQFPALLVQADDVTVQNMVFSRSTDSSPLDATAYRCCVVVSGKRFQSIDCAYLAANASCVYLSNGLCDGTVIRGGEMTTGPGRQSGSGVYVAEGPVLNRNIMIDGVYIHDTTTGVSLFDSSDCEVVNCRVQGIRALPSIPVKNWANVAGDVWRARIAKGTPAIDGVVSDRDDGSTNVVSVDGTQLGGVFPGTFPDVNVASEADGYLYINLGGTDPNSKNILSGIVSGYAYMVYTKMNPCQNNRIVNSVAEDCDGFGIYFQVGLNGDGIGDNQAIGNTLRSVCLRGNQFDSLPFGGIGVLGGSNTILMDNVIEVVGSLAHPATGIRTIPSLFNQAPSGRIIGTTVRSGTAHGYRINARNWALENCHADQNANTGFLIETIWPDQIVDNIVLSDCIASRKGADGFSIDGRKSVSGYLSVRIKGGTSDQNGLRGAVFVGEPPNSVRNSELIGMRLRNNGSGPPAQPQIWVQSGTSRTTIDKCEMLSSTLDSVGLLVESGAIDTIVGRNEYTVGTH